MSSSAELDQNVDNKLPLDVHPCVTCGKSASNCCAACRSVWYCGSDHQRDDWKKGHKNVCQTWIEARDEKRGLHYCAKNDLMAGTRIFERRPILVIPKKICAEALDCSPRHSKEEAEMMLRYMDNKINVPIRVRLVVPCLGCHEYLQWPHCENDDLPEEETWDPTVGSVECSKCGWPMHNKTCEMNEKHEEECKILSENKVRFIDLKSNICDYDDRLLFLGVLRAVILKTKNPKDYETLMKMPYKKDRLLSSITGGKKHRNKILVDSEYGPVIEYCKWFVLTACKMDQVVSGPEVEKIHRILMENRYHCNDVPAMKTRYCDIIFDGERGRVFPHSCLPNCTAYIPADSYTATFKTIVPVAAGEVLTINYHEAWTQMLRFKGLTVDSRVCTHLYNYSSDLCDCPRCSDPTENGSMFSAVRCQKQKCNGYLLPVDVFDVHDESKWACNECKCERRLDEIEPDIFLADCIIKYTKHVADPNEKIKLIRLCLKTLREQLHPNHYMIFNTLMNEVLKHGMHEILAAAEENSATGARSIQKDVLKFVEEYLNDFDHVLNLMDKVSPGRSMARGYFEFGRCLLLISKLAKDIVMLKLNASISQHEYLMSKALELDKILKTADDGLAMFKEVPLADRKLLKKCRQALTTYKSYLSCVISVPDQSGQLSVTDLPEIFQNLKVI